MEQFSDGAKALSEWLKLQEPALHVSTRTIPISMWCTGGFPFPVCKSIHLITILFQCKFSNLPGGCTRPDCPYFHPDRSTRAGDLHNRLQRSTSRSSRENDRGSPYPPYPSYPQDKPARAGNGSNSFGQLRRSTSRSSRENDRSSPYFHPHEPAQTGDGSNSFGQLRRSESRSSRENDRSSPADRLQGGIKRNIQTSHYETSSPDMHGTEGLLVS